MDLQNKLVLRTAVTLCLVVDGTRSSGCLVTVQVHAVHTVAGRRCEAVDIAVSVSCIRGFSALPLAITSPVFDGQFTLY